ncbi:MAG: alpha/beta fold hydrolase [Bacteroidota bacterium]
MGNPTEIKIACSDGFHLKGSLFEINNPKAALMIGPATGIKRKIYQAFASYLSEHGYAVLSFNNRGIGDSKGSTINEGNPSLLNWGNLDMTAVLAYLKEVYPNKDYHLIGHSAGGQLPGLMENALELKSIFNVASSSGSISNLDGTFKLQSLFFLNFFIPISNFFFGQTNSQWVGMGEPLPKKVASDWSRWCNGKGYVQVDLDTKIKKHYYHEMEVPALWIHPTDDKIANFENVKDMIRVFPKMRAQIKTMDPKDYGLKEIGHMKFFHPKNNVLWKYALDWFDQFYSGE